MVLFGESRAGPPNQLQLSMRQFVPLIHSRLTANAGEIPALEAMVLVRETWRGPPFPSSSMAERPHLPLHSGVGRWWVETALGSHGAGS